MASRIGGMSILDEAITLFVNVEPESAKLILRDLVNATMGFEALAEEIHCSGAAARPGWPG